ncbi:TPA: transglycosylase SLT domain-containing protein [Pseudomonas aeruginosa]|nr:transglycosylase SLT domain-containing protein [Pseudomonas aeruginosa]
MKRLILVAGLLSSVNAMAVDSVDFKTLAAQCAPGVHIKTLSSIVRHESRVNPYAIGLNAKGARLPRQPVNKAEAVATASWLKANGYNFDSGFGQVNSSNIAMSNQRCTPRCLATTLAISRRACAMGTLWPSPRTPPSTSPSFCLFLPEARRQSS